MRAKSGPKPIPPSERARTLSVRLHAAHRLKFAMLGGSEWLRLTLDATPLPPVAERPNSARRKIFRSPC